MSKKEEKTELEKCKAILGTRYQNFVIIVADEHAPDADYNCAYAAYGLAVAFIKKMDNEQENLFD